MLGAAKSGYDPWEAYIAATGLALEKLAKSVPAAETISPLAAGYLPRSQGGWGCPTMTAWVTKECRDELSEHNHIIKEFCKMFTIRGVELPVILAKTIAAEKKLPWETETATALCKNPFQKRRKGVVAPTTLQHDTLLMRLNIWS